MCCRLLVYSHIFFLKSSAIFGEDTTQEGMHSSMAPYGFPAVVQSRDHGELGAMLLEWLNQLRSHVIPSSLLWKEKGWYESKMRAHKYHAHRWLLERRCVDGMEMWQTDHGPPHPTQKGPAIDCFAGIDGARMSFFAVFATFILEVPGVVSKILDAGGDNDPIANLMHHRLPQVLHHFQNP